MPKRITLRDVSAKVGLHYSTVSLALRGDYRIAVETREKVLAAAEEIGYQPDAMLSALSSFRHGQVQGFVGTVGYLIPEPVQDFLAAGNGRTIAYLAAKAESERRGLKLDLINAYEPGLSPERVASLLLARGIRGLILSPLSYPADYIALPWHKFCVVTIGYSVLSPNLHRACMHQSRSMRTLLRNLRELGYQRIGLMMDYNAAFRTDFNFLGAYLAEQQFEEASRRLQPLFKPSYTAADLRAWLDDQRPDCVIGCNLDDHRLMLAAGAAMPRDHGFCLLSLNKTMKGFAGMDELWEDVGVSAVSMVLSLLRSNEQGVPAHPRFALIEGEWRWAPTVRAPAKKKAPARARRRA